MNRRTLTKGLVAAAATRCLPRRRKPKQLPPEGGFTGQPTHWTTLMYGWGIGEGVYFVSEIVGKTVHNLTTVARKPAAPNS